MSTLPDKISFEGVRERSDPGRDEVLPYSKIIQGSKAVAVPRRLFTLSSTKLRSAAGTGVSTIKSGSNPFQMNHFSRTVQDTIGLDDRTWPGDYAPKSW